jgi:LysM repeat protein
MSNDDEDITREFWGVEPPRRAHATARRPAGPGRRLSDSIDPTLGRNLLVVGIALFALGGLSAFAGGDGTDDVDAEVVVSVAEPSVAETSVAETTVAEPTVAEPDPCGMRYEIHAGDYWIRIADEAGIRLGELLAANGATTDSLLLPGDQVCLPAGAAMPSPPTTTMPTATMPTTTPPVVRSPATTAPATTAPATTAPATTAPATTAPARPSSGESADRVQAMIREVFPDDQHETALRVARRESNYRPGVYNGHCCYGVFQIHWGAHRRWLANHGVTDSSQLLDARTNIEMAWVLYQRSGGWGPWSQTAH